LHVLVFLDIGMSPRMAQLGALRLAPVQCTTWGHPLTSGLPTIDYYLSSDLMEPDNAQDYYTEKLIRLPGIGINFRKPLIPTVCFYKTRADFGIRHDAVVYLSCQSAFKYLPQHDDVFPAIAKLAPNAQFVFISPNKYLANDFKERRNKAFLAAGVPIGDKVVLVPRLDNFSYCSLNSLSDIYLDTIDWSGCNTTLEAIACRLPVVTLPGEFMRGRHSSAILTQAGVTETIACDKTGFIEIAAKLGLDREWRTRVVQKLVGGYSRLYSDKRCVRSLEDFYHEVVGGAFN
jgi:protein O-GlcNAc transferase